MGEWDNGCERTVIKGGDGERDAAGKGLAQRGWVRSYEKDGQKWAGHKLGVGRPPRTAWHIGRCGFGRFDGLFSSSPGPHLFLCLARTTRTLPMSSCRSVPSSRSEPALSDSQSDRWPTLRLNCLVLGFAWQPRTILGPVAWGQQPTLRESALCLRWPRVRASLIFHHNIRMTTLLTFKQCSAMTSRPNRTRFKA